MKSKNFGRTKSTNSRSILSFIRRNKREIKIGVIVGIILLPLGVLQFICQIPIQSLIEQSPKFVLFVKSLFATPPTIEIKRSLFNNMFSFVKSSKNIDSLVVTGVNTTYQVWVKVKNNSEEELFVKSLEVFDSQKRAQIAKTEYSELGAKIKPLSDAILKVETISLFGNDDALRWIEKGKLILMLNSNLGSVSREIYCICFFNGRKMPNGKFLYALGKDTNCVEFELNDPEGLKATGNPEVVQ